MMNSHFNLIKQRVSVADACKMYGIELNRAKKARCPFHNEKEASFSVKGNIFKCFGCGEGGDVVALVQKLFNLLPHEALEKLNYDFRIGFDLKHKPERKEVIRYRQDQELKKQFKRWKQSEMDKLILNFRELHFASMDPSSPKFVEALQNIDLIDYKIEWLEEDPLSYYKAVKNVEQRRRA